MILEKGKIRKIKQTKHEKSKTKVKN
jgi:hypothetical protein